MKGHLAVLAWLAFVPACRAAPVPDTLEQRTLACAACHGQQGRATNQGYFPRIAGKPAGYLLNQLRNFRDGRRSNAAMSLLVEHLSDAYLAEIAGYFSALDLPYPPPAAAAAPAQQQRGEALVRHGDPARRIPACTACHGAALTGTLPAFPGLLGLSRDYLIAQFGNWRTGLRHAAEPDCMREVAQRLTAEDVGALAAWLASQPVPAPAKPAAALEAPAPLECGSGRQ